MFEDGQKIYRNNPAKRERFTFSKVLELVSGAGGQTPEPQTIATQNLPHTYLNPGDFTIIAQSSAPKNILQLKGGSGSRFTTLELSDILINLQEINLFHWHLISFIIFAIPN